MSDCLHQLWQVSTNASIAAAPLCPILVYRVLSVYGADLDVYLFVGEDVFLAAPESDDAMGASPTAEGNISGRLDARLLPEGKRPRVFVCLPLKPYESYYAAGRSSLELAALTPAHLALAEPWQQRIPWRLQKRAWVRPLQAQDAPALFIKCVNMLHRNSP